MLLAAGLLTRSFGFLAGLFVLATAWMVWRHRQMVWRIAPVLVVLVLIGAMFYSLRRGAIEQSNPVSLRAMNWLTAWTIFAAHPLGTGLNTYGVVYSQYMLPGANETQYTHNTPLQLLSELGYPALLAGACLLLVAMRQWRRGQHRLWPPFMALALLVWGMHNLIDINVYFPSLGVIGAVMLGVFLRSSHAAPQPQPAKAATLAVVVFGMAMLALAGLTMVSSELQYRAQREAEENKFAEAAETLELAKTVMPLNSSLFHDSGDINLNLYHRKRDIKYLERAANSFRRAIALSPEKVGPHIGLSLCLSSANRVDEALEELRIAEKLNPDGENIHAIARLLEKRKARKSGTDAN
jgi:tetratricopeptide (TPR) repeat protein